MLAALNELLPAIARADFPDRLAVTADAGGQRHSPLGMQGLPAFLAGRDRSVH